ncbi:transposase, partial [Bacillus cereus group sp. N15]|uniref:transposase n=1 Tax=Bacillus cereus group sp. N15 TaxID=2794588 RepID=UPI001F5B95C9
HDRTYGSLCAPTVTANDLCIRDLGYFHLKDLQHIKDKKAYYISRIKSNTRIYQKNPKPDYFQDGRIKKGTEYIQIDMEVLMNSLQPGQTYEISDAYVGMTDKVPARVIVHRLTKEHPLNRFDIELETNEVVLVFYEFEVIESGYYDCSNVQKQSIDFDKDCFYVAISLLSLINDFTIITLE